MPSKQPQREPIACHDSERPKGTTAPFWRDPMPQAHPTGWPFRTCSYCGGIHPADLLAFLERGATLRRVKDDKAWPHQFAVDGIANPQAGQSVVTGREVWTDNDGQVHTKDYLQTGAATVTARWYALHFLDIQADEELFEGLSLFVERQTGVLFYLRDDGQCRWRTYEKPSHEEPDAIDEG